MAPHSECDFLYLGFPAASEEACGFPVARLAVQETQVHSLGQEDALEKGMAIHTSILPWRNPWNEETGRLQSMGSQRDTSEQLTLSLWRYLFLQYIQVNITLGEGNGTPLQYSCLENPMDGGAWWAAVHGVAKSRTRLSNFTFTFHFHALEEEMATHSNVLA